jgi:hypothetical protein
MVKGSCLCKGIQFEVQGQFGEMMDCFCSMCRKAHGAAYATFVGCDAADFRWVQGKELIRTYQSSPKGTRSFCGVCGSNTPMEMDDKVYIPAGLLDGDPGVRTSVHLFVASKAPWVEITDDATQYDEYPTG